MISGSNEQLQQEFEYTLLNPDCHISWISRMQSVGQDTLEERYAIKFCFKLGKNATETYGMLQTVFGASCMNRSSVFEWYKRFKEGRESVKDNKECGRSTEFRTPGLIDQRLGLVLRRWGFKGVQERFRRKRPALLKLAQWHFHQDITPVHNSDLNRDYLTKVGIKTVPHLPHRPDFAPDDLLLFPKLRGYRYETIKDMKEVATKIIDTLTQEDFHGVFQKLLER